MTLAAILEARDAWADLAAHAPKYGIDPTEFARRAKELRRDAVRAEQRRVMRALGTETRGLKQGKPV